MQDQARWVVLHSTILNGPTLQVPKLVAELIGLRADLPSPGSGIAFMTSGPRVLRVMAVADPSVGATKESTDALVGVATPTKQLLFSLPKAAKQHLALGPWPVVAWIVPADGWEEGAGPPSLRPEERAGGGFRSASPLPPCSR